jgi:hypothetical protein
VLLVVWCIVVGCVVVGCVGCGCWSHGCDAWLLVVFLIYSVFVFVLNII